MSTRMQQRRGTATQWTSLNEGQGPILAAGEIGFESDTNKFKIGDGVNHWVDLTYFTDAQSAINSISSLVDGAPDLLNTLNELAAAIGDDPSFITTVATNLSNHQSDTTNIHGITDTAELATMSYVTSAIAGSGLATPQDIIDHAAVTTAVHGITDAANIVYTADLTTHTSATQDVHGIADTSILATTTGAQTLSNKTIADPIITHYDVGTDITTTISSTELSYLDGVNSNIQTQLNAKASTEYVDTAISGAEVDQSTLAGAGLNWTGTQFEVGVLDTPTISTSLTLDGTGDFTISADANIVLSAVTEVYVGTAAAGNEVATSSDVTTATANKQDKVSGVSDTEIGYLDGVTSKIQDQIDTKAPSDSPTFTGTVILPSTTSVGNVSSTEIGYLDGVTSAIQAQINTKAPLADPTFTGTTHVANIEISGALTFLGTATQIDTTNLAVSDSLIYLADSQFTSDLLDIGIYGAYGSSGNNASNHPHTGFFRDATDSKWKLISGGTEPTDGVIDLTGVTYDTLKIGALEATSATIGNVSNTELQYLDGVTSAIQTQLDSKLASSTASSTYAPLSSPALTGTPTAPTAAALTNTTQIATTAYVQEDNKVAYVSVSGTSLTLSQASHLFRTIHCTSSSAVTVSIPTDASDNWPVGTYVNIRQMGSGQISVVAATPATTTVVATDNQFKTRVQYSEIVIEKISANNWIVVGDTAA